MRRDLESRRLKRKLGKANQRAIKAEARHRELSDAIWAFLCVDRRLVKDLEQCRKGLETVIKSYTRK